MGYGKGKYGCSGPGKHFSVHTAAAQDTENRYPAPPRSTPGTISGHKKRATDGTRTRDLHLGKVAYYQLYYYRMCTSFRLTHYLLYKIPQRLSRNFFKFSEILPESHAPSAAAVRSRPGPGSPMRAIP